MAAGMKGRVTVTVIGAGIAGPTCAIRLQKRGWTVRVVADRPLTGTTSMVAAAVWFPTLSGPREKVVRWGRNTFVELEHQARGCPAC